MADTQSFIRPEILWQTVGLKAGQTVVHLGCGPGFYVVSSAKIVGMGGQAIGVDIRPDMLVETTSRAQREGVEKNVRTIRGNIENANGTTLADASADVVLMVSILHQSHPGKVLSEAVRVVKPEGRLVIIAWNTSATAFGPPVEKRISEADMKETLTNYKLRVVKTFSPSPYHYGLVVQHL